MKILKIILMSLLCISLSAFADTEKKHMRFTLANDSDEILSFVGVDNSNQENLFIVSPKLIMPGSHITVTIISSDYNTPDMSGDLRFEDEMGKIHLFHVSNAEQMHFARQELILSDKQDILQLTNSDSPKLDLQAINL